MIHEIKSHMKYQKENGFAIPEKTAQIGLIAGPKNGEGICKY